jgi:hypothetical protein
MVAYPMKRCRGEHRINRMIVGEDLFNPALGPPGAW